MVVTFYAHSRNPIKSQNKKMHKISKIISFLPKVATTVIIFYSIWLIIRICLVDYFIIPSDSMYPTLKPGDKVIVNKTLMGGRIYKNFHFEEEGVELESWRLKGFRGIKHNDICIFNVPKHNNKISFVINHCYCKRCIGLPGDSVWVKNGFYHNNNFCNVLGLEEAQDKLHNIPDSLLSVRGINGNKMGWTLRNSGPIYLPRKGECLTITPREAILYHYILHWEIGKKIKYDMETGVVTAGIDTLKSHTFQHNYYFMAGDNVCSSNDSRYWGLVPEEYIIGIVGWVIPGK